MVKKPFVVVSSGWAISQFVDIIFVVAACTGKGIQGL